MCSLLSLVVSFDVEIREYVIEYCLCMKTGRHIMTDSLLLKKVACVVTKECTHNLELPGFQQ